MAFFSTAILGLPRPTVLRPMLTTRLGMSWCPPKGLLFGFGTAGSLQCWLILLKNCLFLLFCRINERDLYTLSQWPMTNDHELTSKLRERQRESVCAFFAFQGVLFVNCCSPENPCRNFTCSLLKGMPKISMLCTKLRQNMVRAS